MECLELNFHQTLLDKLTVDFPNKVIESIEEDTMEWDDEHDEL